MAKYKINSLSVKTTSTGKKKMDAEVIDEQGTLLSQKITIWGDYPSFETITFGSIVEGDLVAAKDSKYGPTLYPPKQTMQQGAARAGGFSPAKVMAQKAEGIKAAQENKDLGIMTSSTIRMAVDISLSENNSAAMGFDGGVFKDRVLHWREWLISQWDNVKIDPTDKPAF